MPEDKKSDAKSDAKVEKTEAQVQQAVDEETEQGFRGVEVDSTPNENYTVKGVLAGKPVPEAAEDPTVARRDASNL
jgi:hypothetical protein